MNETRFHAPLIIRGEVVADADVEFGGRGSDTRFLGADVTKYLDRLPLPAPSGLSDLYALSFEQILDYLEELGERLEFSQNRHLQESMALTIRTSGLGPDIIRACYENLGRVFNRRQMRQEADLSVGIPFLEGWVSIRDDPGYNIAVRAFGARSVHIIAGNVPTVSAVTVIRNALTRSDMIIKTPSNDPLTAVAIARTMIDMAPDHPITKHLSVGYWKGGDARVEDFLYRPRNIEKIVAWGGLASVKHVAKYIQPGIDLITLDPKLSSTIIGQEAFVDEATMRRVAARLALDVAAYNQQACVNARVVYIQTGTDQDGIQRANQFGRLLLTAIEALPSRISGPATTLDPSLADEIEGLRFSSDRYQVLGGERNGGVIISQCSEPVEFAALLNHRVANLVPVDDLEIPIRSVTAYTQTIGIYPNSLIAAIRDRLAFHGTQRLVSLGYATRAPLAGPQDAIEPMRRMLKWIMQETYDSDVVPAMPA
jgi:hypothetical protein